MLKMAYEDEMKRALDEDGSKNKFIYSSTKLIFHKVFKWVILLKVNRSLAISDRSGMQFPYNEMVREWNGSIVHYSEFEAKQPQLNPPHHKADAVKLF
jgi:hypothetical protein